MTVEALRTHARRRYEALAAVNQSEADDAAAQTGLSDIWVWDTLSVRQARTLALACAIRLLDAGHALG